MSFRAFFLDPGSSPYIVDLYSQFTNKRIEPQKGDDLPKVSHVPSKAVALNPNFGCHVVILFIILLCVSIISFL